MPAPRSEGSVTITVDQAVCSACRQGLPSLRWARRASLGSAPRGLDAGRAAAEELPGGPAVGNGVMTIVWVQVNDSRTVPGPHVARPALGVTLPCAFISGAPPGEESDVKTGVMVGRTDESDAAVLCSWLYRFTNAATQRARPRWRLSDARIERLRRRDEVVKHLIEERGNVSAVARKMNQERHPIRRWLRRCPPWPRRLTVGRAAAEGTER